jgi:O-antigen/teichoic acid export membrane protein
MITNRLLLYFQKNTLLKSSFFLLTSNLLASGTGFFFWLIVARFYSSENVGLATALFSLSNLIASISLVGLNTGLLKYLPLSDQKNEKINTSITIVLVVTIVLTIGVILALPFLSESLLFIQKDLLYVFLFIFITVSTTLNSLVDAILIAYRGQIHVLVKTVLQSIVKITLPIFTVFLGAFGIFIAFSFGTVSALIYGAVIIVFYYHVLYRLQFHTHSIKKMAKVSFGTYIANLITSIPSFILPLFITNSVGVKETAYYFIAATTANVLFMIPQVITQNVLVESSYDEGNVIIHTKKAIKLISFLLIPGIIILFLFGDRLLTFFGKEYSVEGLMLLHVLSLSSIFVGINYILGTLFIIYNELKFLVFVNTIATIALLSLSFLFLPYGIIGIGYATIFSQIALVILSVCSFYMTRKINLLKFIL